MNLQADSHLAGIAICAYSFMCFRELLVQLVQLCVQFFHLLLGCNWIQRAHHLTRRLIPHLLDEGYLVMCFPNNVQSPMQTNTKRLLQVVQVVCYHTQGRIRREGLAGPIDRACSSQAARQVHGAARRGNRRRPQRHLPGG